MKRFAERLARARSAKGVSKHELEELSGLSRGAIKAYERGTTLPRIDSLAKLAEALGVSINWLAYGNHPPKADRELMAKLVAQEKRLEEER